MRSCAWKLRPHLCHVRTLERGTPLKLRCSWNGVSIRFESTFSSPGNISRDNGRGNAGAPAEPAAGPLQPSWSWVPPRAGEVPGDSEDCSIPVIKKKLLTMEEIVDALKKLGGENVVEIEMVDKIDTITHCVITTGNSRRHLRKMAEAIVSALKARDLRIAPGYTGAEGADDDDWLLVDCYDSAVHFMLADTREALKLEEHLLTKDKPYVKYSRNEEEYDKEMDRLLEKYPVPENYNVQTDFPSSNSTGSKKKKKKKLDNDGYDFGAQAAGKLP